MAAGSWKDDGQGWPRERREEGEEGRAPVAWRVGMKHHWCIHSQRLAMQADNSTAKNTASLWRQVAPWSSTARRPVTTCSCRETGASW